MAAIGRKVTVIACKQSLKILVPVPIKHGTISIAHEIIQYRIKKCIILYIPRKANLEMFLLVVNVSEMSLQVAGDGKANLEMFLLVVNVSEMSLQVAGDGKANLEMFLLVVNVSEMPLQQWWAK
jgi:hypothetical protein